MESYPSNKTETTIAIFDPDAQHQDFRKRVNSLTNILDAVYYSLSKPEARSLPTSFSQYIDAMLARAQRDLASFGEQLAEAIFLIYQDGGGTRFVFDYVRGVDYEVEPALLFLDSDGNLVSVKSPVLDWDVAPHSKNRILKSYDFYSVLTGPLRGQQFSASMRPLKEPVFRPGFVASSAKLMSSDQILV